MAKEFNLSVVTPDSTVCDEFVESTVLPGVAGYLGVMADHESMIVALRPGVLEYRDKASQRHHVSIGGGFAEVGSGRVIVLANDARRAQEIDVAETEHRLEQARRALRGEPSELTTDEAQHEMETALARLRAARSR